MPAIVSGSSLHAQTLLVEYPTTSSSPCTRHGRGGAVARRQAGRDAGELLGLPACGVAVAATLRDALARPADVLVDFTSPESVKPRALEALARGVRAVIGDLG